MEIMKNCPSELYDLRINDLVAPMGIDRKKPIFSWKMRSGIIGAKQTAYAITVAHEKGNVVWDTGWVDCDRSVNIRYEGADLESAVRYDVTVKVKDQAGQELAPITTHFEMGLLDEQPLGQAQWITMEEEAGEKTGNRPGYRKAFLTREDATIVKARLYSTALGVYENYINGQRVGRILEDGRMVYEELKPGYTQMEDRKFYSTYDVTGLLENGKENVLAAVVTTGWWNGPVVQYMMPENKIYHESAYMAKLVITYSDGSVSVLDTDLSWKASRVCAVQEGTGIWEGEVYNAGIDYDWMNPGYCDCQWNGVKINREFHGVLCAWNGSTVQLREELEHSPKKITLYQGATGAKEGFHGKINVLETWDDIGAEGIKLLPGQVLLVDFGQNFAGWEYLELKTAPGTRIDIRHGEILNDRDGQVSRGNEGPEGSLYNANYTKNTPTVGRTIYYARGGEKECYHPTFTFYGFRYVEILVQAETVIYKVAGQVVTSALEDTGILVTSDEAVNRLIANARWGMYSNYLSVPTDCPQRDERQAWTADTQNFAEAGCYLNRSKSFLEKYMVDIRDAQDEVTGSVPGVAPTGYKYGARWGTVGWADAVVLIPWFLYQMYGDKTVIRENWDSMVFFMDTYMANTNGMGGNYGTLNSPSGEKIGAYGDWLSLENGSQEVSDRLGVAYYAWDAMLMAKMAKIIGKNDEEGKYEKVYQEEKELFQRNYVKEDGTLDMNVQSVCLHALYLDLLPNDASVAAVTKQLIDNIESKGNKLGTGFLGTEIIMHTLTKLGRNDVAYKLLLQHGYPSWLYSVDQGATTIWERWNAYTVENGLFGDDPKNNSFNHYSYGSVVAWMFRGMAGISYDEADPGFKHIYLMPQPDKTLPVVEASYDSAYGMIVSNMRYEADGWHYEAQVPANTDATLLLPVADLERLQVNGIPGYDHAEGLVFAGYDPQRKIATFQVAAGQYTFLVP